MKTKKIKKNLLAATSVLAIIFITILALETFSAYKATKTIHLEAPVITKKSIIINAPVEKVWKIFSDVNHWNTWQKEIKNPQMKGEFKAGTIFNWESNGLTITSTLQTVERYKKVAWSGPAFGAFAIHTWSFKTKNGKTIVSVEESMEGWLVQILKSKFQSSLDTSIENWLHYLKTASERETK